MELTDTLAWRKMSARNAASTSMVVMEETNRDARAVQYFS